VAIEAFEEAEPEDGASGGSVSTVPPPLPPGSNGVS